MVNFVVGHAGEERVDTRSEGMGDGVERARIRGKQGRRAAIGCLKLLFSKLELATRGFFFFFFSYSRVDRSNLMRKSTEDSIATRQDLSPLSNFQKNQVDCKEQVNI